MVPAGPRCGGSDRDLRFPGRTDGVDGTARRARPTSIDALRPQTNRRCRRRQRTMSLEAGRRDDPVRPGPWSRARSGVTAVRTIKLCAAPTNRPTTLLAAIARAAAELERTGRPARPARLVVQPR